MKLFRSEKCICISKPISAALFSRPQVQDARVPNNLAARQRPSHGTIIPMNNYFFLNVTSTFA